MSVTAPNPNFFTLPDTGGFPTSQQEFYAQWLSAMQAQYPGYTPAAANIENILALVVASWAADVAQLCTAGAVELFTQFCEQLLNLQPELGNPAISQLTVTAQDSNGYTLPAATQVTLTLGGAQVGFQTVTDLTIPSGSSSGSVNMTAMVAGASFNGATTPAQIVTPVSWVTGVTATTASGGVDPEDSTAFQQRMANLLQLMAPRPITASDFANMALSFAPASGTDQEEVGRATAIDGYNPEDGSSGNERMVCVCVTDSDGDALNSDTMTAVQDWLQSMRETNFVVNVIAPTSIPIYVAVTVGALSGFDAAAVQQSVQDTILATINPAVYGLPPGASVGWQNNTTLRQSVVESAIQQTSGVAYVAPGTLLIDTADPPVNSGDLALTGAFPLPNTTTSTVPLSAITVQTS